MSQSVRSLSFFLFIVLLSGAALIFFKFIAPNNLSAPKTKPTIAATIFPIYDIAKNLAGEDLETILILPPGADAHSFEPTPSLIKELNGTTVVYIVGGRLDNWSSILASNVGAETFTVNDGIILRAANDEEDGEFDPHYWLSVKNAEIITFNIASDLSRRFPEYKEQIANRAAAYMEELEKIDQEIRQTLQNLPQKNIVTFHDAWYYFAEEYGLTIAGTFEPTAGREPTPQWLSNLTATLSQAQVKTMYYEPQMSIDGLKTFAQDNNINLAVLDDIGGQSPYDSYINLIKTNVSALQKNQ